MIENMLEFKTFEWVDGIDFEDIQTIEAVREGDPRIYLTPAGQYPSMTSVLGLLTDHAQLNKWRKRVGLAEAERIVAEAITIGNALHDYNEKYLRNTLTREELSGTAGVLFNRVKKHLDKIEVVVGAEAPLYSQEFEYAGRCDAIGIYDKKLCIIDHKNTRTPMKENSKWGRQKLWKYKLQTCGYSRALAEMTGLKATHGFIDVGNRNPIGSDLFTFEFDEKLNRDLDILLEVYHSDLPETARARKLKGLTYYSL